jgi:hypothetical protein
LSSPHREALTNATKKIERKRSKKKSPRKKFHPKKYFPGDFFLKRTHFFKTVFSNSPCRETPKNALKKKKKRRRYVRTFFCELAQMYVVFSFYFFGRPLIFDSFALHAFKAVFVEAIVRALGAGVMVMGHRAPSFSAYFQVRTPAGSHLTGPAPTCCV